MTKCKRILEFKEEYCTSRELIEKLQNHWTIEEGFISTEHIKKEYDSGRFGWVCINFDTTSSLLSFFKALIREEVKAGILK